MRQTRDTMRGADAIARTLKAFDVEVVFGMCGHGDLALLDGFAGAEIDFVSVHHEQVGVHAADAYFRVSHKPGVVVTTLGPGALNATTALADAALDGSALLLISGDVPSRFAGLGAYQEIGLHADDEQDQVTRPITKRNFHVRDAASLPHVLSRAWQEATTGCPGPVHVHVPLDLFSATAEFEIPVPIKLRPPALAAEVASEIADWIRAAERPVIYAGGGVQTAEATDELRRFAEAAAVPVATSMIGQGAIPETHALSLGFCGVVGTEPANAAVREADLVIGVGTRFPEMDSSSWRADAFLDPDRCDVIHIDIDARELTRIYQPVVGAVADARLALAQLAELFEAHPVRRESYLRRLETAMTAWRARLVESQRDDSFPMQPARIIAQLREAMPEDAILVSGVGVRHLVGQHFPVTVPRTMLVASGFSTMGWETAAAVGAKAAARKRPVVALIGDGAFHSTVSAVSTSVAHDLPVIWIVMDNHGYQSIAVYQDKHFGRRYATDFDDRRTGETYETDYVALARAYGADGERVEQPDDLAGAIDRGLKQGGHYLIHVPTTGRPTTKVSGQWDVNQIMGGTADVEPAPFGKVRR